MPFNLQDETLLALIDAVRDTLIGKGKGDWGLAEKTCHRLEELEADTADVCLLYSCPPPWLAAKEIIDRINKANVPFWKLKWPAQAEDDSLAAILVEWFRRQFGDDMAKRASGWYVENVGVGWIGGPYPWTLRHGDHWLDYYGEGAGYHTEDAARRDLKRARLGALLDRREQMDLVPEVNELELRMMAGNVVQSDAT